MVGVLRSSSEAEEPDLWHVNSKLGKGNRQIHQIHPGFNFCLFFFPQPLDVSAWACWVDILFSSGCYLIRSGNRDRRDLNETVFGQRKRQYRERTAISTGFAYQGGIGLRPWLMLLLILLSFSDKKRRCAQEQQDQNELTL